MMGRFRFLWDLDVALPRRPLKVGLLFGWEGRAWERPAGAAAALSGERMIFSAIGRGFVRSLFGG